MQRLVVLLMIAFLSIPNLLAVDPPCPPPDPMWPRICQTNWLYLDCDPDDGVENMCIIEYEWCWQLKYDSYGNITERNVTVKNFTVVDESLCTCINYEMEILLSIFSQTSILEIKSANDYSINFFVSPCWVIADPVFVECTHASCCEESLEVSYKGTYDPTDGSTYLTIDTILTTGTLNAVDTCEPGCSSECDRWFATDEDWSDRLDDSIIVITVDTVPIFGRRSNSHSNENGNNLYPSVVYPNPTTGKINIKIESLEEKYIDLLISDLEGNKIALMNNLPYNKEDGLVYNLKDFSKGTYLYKIKVNNRIITSGKIIKE